MVILYVFLGLNLAVVVFGHGRLIDPASRNSAWRFGFKTPRQDTDNELNCGGFSVQWNKNKGKCGVCGDAYDSKNPQYVSPGKYAKGIITKTYREAQKIEVVVEITSNHQGFFTFRVGEIGKAPITQEKLRYVLLQPSGQNTWPLHSSKNDNFSIPLVLPKGLTCDHCVMQWWWTVGNNWGCDENGNCGVGLGKKQETFVNCADIRITRSDGSVPPPPTSTEKPPEHTTKTPTEPPPTNPPNPGGCMGTGAHEGNAGMDVWCQQNCAKGHCPADMCKCE